MIDWSRIAELKRAFEDDFVEVVDLFIEETDEIIDRMTNGSSPDLAGDLHFVKGSAENMGMAELAAICRSGETDIAAGRQPPLGEVRRVYEASCAEIRRKEVA